MDLGRYSSFAVRQPLARVGPGQAANHSLYTFFQVLDYRESELVAWVTSARGRSGSTHHRQLWLGLDGPRL